MSDEEYGQPAKKRLQKERRQQQLAQEQRYDEDSLESGDEDEDREEADPWPDEKNGGMKLDDLNLARVKRMTLEKFIEEPFIGKAISDCFVRYMIGEHHGVPTYRVCQIKGVTQCATSYTHPVSKKSTHQMLTLSIAGATKDGKIHKVSNHLFTQPELESWRSKMRDARIPTVTPADCKRLHQRMKDVINNHEYTTSEIQEMVAKKTKGAVRGGRLNLAQARIKITNDKEAVLQEIQDATTALEGLQKKEAGASRCQRKEEQLYELEEKLKGLEDDEAAVLHHQKEREELLKANDKLSSVNVKNRSANVVVDGEDSRKVLRQEFLGGDAVNDAFRTTRTRMVDLWKTAGSGKAEEADPFGGGSNEFLSATKDERDYVKQAYQGGGVDATTNGKKSGGRAGSGQAVMEFARSEKGLKRPKDPAVLLTRKRRGMSLNEWIQASKAD